MRIGPPTTALQGPVAETPFVRQNPSGRLESLFDEKLPTFATKSQFLGTNGTTPPPFQMLNVNIKAQVPSYHRSATFVRDVTAGFRRDWSEKRHPRPPPADWLVSTITRRPLVVRRRRSVSADGGVICPGPRSAAWIGAGSSRRRSWRDLCTQSSQLSRAGEHQ